MLNIPRKNPFISRIGTVSVKYYDDSSFSGQNPDEPHKVFQYTALQPCLMKSSMFARISKPSDVDVSSFPGLAIFTPLSLFTSIRHPCIQFRFGRLIRMTLPLYIFKNYSLVVSFHSGTKYFFHQLWLTSTYSECRASSL